MTNYELKVLPFIRLQKINNPLLQVYFVGTQFELKELSKVLQTDEELVYLTACKWNGGQKVLVTVTNKRLILINKGVVLDRTQHAIFLDRVTSVIRARKIYFGSVQVYLQGNEQPFILNGFWGSDTENFVNALEKARYDYETIKYQPLIPQGYQQPYQTPKRPSMKYKRASVRPFGGNVSETTRKAPAWDTIVDDVKSDISDLEEAFNMGIIDRLTFERKVKERSGRYFDV